MDDDAPTSNAEEAVYERWLTIAERYDVWMQESRDRRFYEEVVKAWAQGVLKKAGLPTRFDPYLFLPDGTYKVATPLEVEACAKLGTRPCDLVELVASLGLPREINMAARALSLLFILRRSLDRITPKVAEEDRLLFEQVFNSIWDLGLIYSEMAMLREPDASRKIREASRKLARQTVDRAEWDKEFALAEKLAAEGKSERQQAQIIAQSTGAKFNAVRDRLRRQRGTARREPKRKE